MLFRNFCCEGFQKNFMVRYQFLGTVQMGYQAHWYGNFLQTIVSCQKVVKKTMKKVVLFKYFNVKGPKLPRLRTTPILGTVHLMYRK